jgi:predicted HAD superfamily Cof-like phosphohydrolase
MPDLFITQAEFMSACEQHIGQCPNFNSEVELWERLIGEEYAELRGALRKFHQSLSADHIVEILHEGCDLLYVLSGLFNSIGVGPVATEAFLRIHAANMAKVDGSTGIVTRRADGKILKPDAWKPADLRNLVIPRA